MKPKKEVVDDGRSLLFFCDRLRHLVCEPYSVENLHIMAKRLGIKRCWFHSGSRYPHYDIPLKRVEEVKKKCFVVPPVGIFRIIVPRKKALK